MGVTPDVNFPASLSPGIQPFVLVSGGEYGWHPGQSISAKHWWPVFAHLAVGPQKFWQLYVVFKGKLTVWLVWEPSWTGPFVKHSTI